MTPARRQPGPFQLDEMGDDLPGQLVERFRNPLQSLLGLPRLNDTYFAVTADGSPSDFCSAWLRQFRTEVRVDPADLGRIPPHGPLVVVANHPFGGIEGLVLASILRSVRPDIKLLANQMLARIPEMREVCIFVDPFETTRARHANVKGLREAIGWLKEGGALGVFPAGEVAHLDLARRKVADSPWNTNLMGLVRRTEAAVLPMFFAGANGPVFQVAGLIHPGLRTALLPRELLNKQHRTFLVRIGSVIPPRELAAYQDDVDATEYLRLRTCVLAGRGAAKYRTRPRPVLRRPREPVVDPVPGEQLAAEIAALPSEARLAGQGSLTVYQASAAQVPRLLLELGRLREVTFRAVGEGTGKSLDLDRFDQRYRHLLLWDQARSELVGAYRLGLSDEILPAHGGAGFYTSSLFELSPAFFEHLGPCIELGRSFVRAEQQHTLGPIMLLWSGIAQFVARHQHYRHMFGPVSVSSAYRPLSRALIQGFLTDPTRRSPLAPLVRPRRPFEPRRAASPELLGLLRQVHDLETLNRVVVDIEPDRKGVPSLLRQYLKLGATALAFNVDPAFGHCLDGLCVFDAARTDRRNMRRYAQDEQIDSFLAQHQPEAP